MFNEQFLSCPKKSNNFNEFLSSCVYYTTLENQSISNQVTLKRKHEEIKCETELNCETSTATSTPAKKSKYFYVKLATESPARTDIDTDIDGSYDTVHDIETGK